MQISLPKPPKIKTQEGNRAIFEIEELYPGYGVTLGNALRRVLYSSLPGAAITQVKIKGVSHEFSTLKGVLEDVLEITLNLKQVYVKLHGDEPQTATIKVKGAKIITGSDIESPSQVEVANKDIHIASLTSKDAQFEAELLIEAGLGYIPVEQHHKTGADIGYIPLDAVFTPVKRVTIEIENMRVGDRTDYNRLRLDVETNGTISPQEAMVYASNLLVEHFQIAGSIKIQDTVKKADKSEKKDKPKKKKVAAKKDTKKTKKSPLRRSAEEAKKPKKK